MNLSSAAAANRAGRILGCLALALAAGASELAAQEIQVSVTRDGDSILVSASAEMGVDRDIAWSVLTDYDHYAEFIPDMQISRVVFRSGGDLIVEQHGESGFLFFTQELDIRMAVLEYPRSRIVSKGISGNLKEFDGLHELMDIPGGTRIVYKGRMVPGFSVPPLIGLAVIRRTIERQFSAMVNEMLRRGERKPGTEIRPCEAARC